MHKSWKGFWQLADPKIWIASTVPMLTGAALAFGNKGRISVFWLLISLIGVYLIEIGKNAVNEFVDYHSGVDRYVDELHRTPFSGGKKTIIDGLLTPAQTALIALLTFAAACLIGLVIVFFRAPAVLWVGLAGVFFAVFYSLPPLKLNYRGFGELLVGLAFGPLIVTGIYIVMVRTFTWDVVLVALPIGFLIANVLWINQYPDFEADMKGGKRNWLVRMGKKKGLGVFLVLFILAYLCFPALALAYRNPFWLLGLLSLPAAVKSVRIARENIEEIQRFIGANAGMVLVYQITGLLMIVAALTNRWVQF